MSESTGSAALAVSHSPVSTLLAENQSRRLVDSYRLAIFCTIDFNI